MTKIKTIPENIGGYLAYDETSKTGLRWIRKTAKCVNAGDEAGCLKSIGYYSTRFNKTEYKNHRIVFFLYHGYCPDCVDHIDNIPTNNKITNLREATRSQNNHNRKINNNNSTGVKGLSSTIVKRTEYWKCSIKGIPAKHFRKDLPNSRQLAEQWLVDNREELHGAFTNHG